MCETSWKHKLDEGDQVYWNDPDEGVSSGHYTVLHNNPIAEILLLADDFGSEVEAFYHEVE
jgi:hypothetical protein